MSNLSDHCWTRECEAACLFRHDCEAELGPGHTRPAGFLHWCFCFRHYHALLCGRLRVGDMETGGHAIDPVTTELRVRLVDYT
jgi:hypothetical protein